MIFGQKIIDYSTTLLKFFCNKIDDSNRVITLCKNFRCVIGKEGKPVCDCKHGTEGETCNRCKPFFHDRPWKRGLKNKPNECKGS